MSAQTFNCLEQISALGEDMILKILSCSGKFYKIPRGKPRESPFSKM